MEPGLFMTFFDVGELPGRELPPVGPVDHLVVRRRGIVADRSSAHQQPDVVGFDPARWLEAELELERALGKEEGGPRRGQMRITATDGVLLRFTAFGDPKEEDLAPELGPFGMVIVGPSRITGDGRVLATRSSGPDALWEPKTEGAPASRKPDIALRTTSTSYHPGVAALPQSGPVADMAASTQPVTIAPAPLLPPEPPPLVWDPSEPLIPPPLVPPSQPSPAAAAEPPRPAQAAAPQAETTPPQEEQVARPTPAAQSTSESSPPPAEPRVTEHVFIERPPRERERYAPPPAASASRPEQALKANDLELIESVERDRTDETLSARIRDQERRRAAPPASEDTSNWTRYRAQAATEAAPEQQFAEDDEGFSLRGALWRLRFLIIGVLLIGAAIYGYTVVTSAVSSSGQVHTVGIGQRVSGDRWDYAVNAVQRFDSIGRKAASGTYVVVRVTATNRKGGDGAQLVPGQFVLIDANGTQYPGESLDSGVYTGTDNPQSPYAWPQPYPVGASAVASVVFDVSKGLPPGMVLAFTDVPTTRVKLE